MEMNQQFTLEREFTVEDVRLFAQLSGDHAVHHQQPNENGQLMVHGLLTSCLPTQLGQTLHYLVRESFSEYLRPVFTGELIQCIFQITEAAPHKRGEWIRATFKCTNPHGKPVLQGWTQGLIPTSPSP